MHDKTLFTKTKNFNMSGNKKSTVIYVSGNYIENQTIHVHQGGILNLNSEEQKEEQTSQMAVEGKAEPCQFPDERIRAAIDILMGKNSRRNKRWWFPVYRVLKDIQRVTDLHGFEIYIHQLYHDSLPVKMDIYDLSKELDVMTFAKSFDRWKPEDSPVGEKTYWQYHSLVSIFQNLLKS